MKKETPITFLVEKSRIKELAEECPEYKHAMEVLFPEVFKLNFSVGDIISAKCNFHDESDKQTGTALGIIKTIDNSIRLCIGVEFFEPMGGHSLDSGKAVDKHGWWHAKDEITFVFRPTKIKEE